MLLILGFSMIQRASVPSLLSFWDERLLHAWFDAAHSCVVPIAPSGFKQEEGAALYAQLTLEYS